MYKRVLKGEYGYNEIAIGVPAILDQHGVKKIIELDFNTQEQQRFENSINVIKGYIQQLPK